MADKKPNWDRHSSLVEGAGKFWYNGGEEMDKKCTHMFKNILD